MRGLVALYMDLELVEDRRLQRQFEIGIYQYLTIFIAFVLAQ